MCSARKSMLQPSCVVPFREICPCMRSAAFFSDKGAVHDDLRDRQEIMEFRSFDESCIEYPALIRDIDILKPFLKLFHSLQSFLQSFSIPEYAAFFHHYFPERLPEIRDFLVSV